MENKDLQNLFRMLLNVRAKFDENLEDLALQMNLNKSELLVILDVMDHPSTSLTEVCKRNGLKKSAASKLIDRLLDREYVTREVCPTSRREVVLNLGEGFAKESFCRNQAMKSLFPNHEDEQIKDLEEMIASMEEVKKLL